MILFRPTYKAKTGEIKTMKNWYLRYRGRRYPLHTESKRTAETLARELVTRLEMGCDPKRIDTAKSSKLSTLLDEFLASLGNAGDERKNALRCALSKIIRETGSKTLSDFTFEKVKAWLRASSNSKRTKAHHTQYLRQFGKWLVSSERMAVNPFLKLDTVRGIEADRRLLRRALSEAEIVTLLAKTPTSPTVWYGMSGADRAWAYRTVLCTGFRRQELGSLRPASFSLDSNPPTATVAAAYTKNKREATQPLPSAFAKELAVYLATKDAQEPVWPVTSRKTADMLREDLEWCGIPVQVGPRVVDWHGLRTTFGSLLAIKGVPLTMGMKLLRHSDPKLSAVCYAVAALGDLSKEIEKLGG